MNIQQRIDQLYAKYLSGNNSAAEWEELLVLISGMEEEDTTTLDGPLKEIWESARLKELPSRAHLAPRDRIYATATASGTEATAPVRFLRLNRRFIAAAAAVIGILLITGLYLVSRKKTAITPITQVTTPETQPPGINKAILTLGGGQQITLDSTSVETAYAQSKSRVVNKNGVLVYEAGADNGGSELVYNKVTTARGNQYQLVLSDGSKVWLNAASSLRYPASFTGSDRTVELTGEAYFEIAKNAARPFRVMVGGLQVNVLGTSFNINAYDDEDLIRTSLLEGAVNVTSHDKTGRLQPGEEASVQKDGGLRIAPGNVELAAAWKNGYFQFDQASLPGVMRQISRWYDLDIQYAGRIPDRLFSGKIQRNLPLAGVLRVLQKGGVLCTLNGKRLTVSGS